MISNNKTAIDNSLSITKPENLEEFLRNIYLNTGFEILRYTYKVKQINKKENELFEVDKPLFEWDCYNK